MPQTTPIISGGMSALRLPAFFENLGHSNVILTAGGRLRPQGWTQAEHYLVRSGRGVLHAVEGKFDSGH
jgi:ribulose 1,5-bisphosphate carboxylase large subunit-like protein